MAMEYFCAYHSYLKAMRSLTDEECGRLFRACLLYSMTGEETDLSGNERFVFDAIIGDIDRSKGHYEERCNTNAENGRKGGRPKKNQTVSQKPNGFPETQETQSKSKSKSESKSKGKSKSDIKASSPSGEDTPQKPPAKQSEAVQWAEYVTMTNAEHDKLLATYGPVDTARLIEMLDNYKGSSGRKYRSDYRAILSWCTDRLEEEKAKAKKTAPVKSSQPSWAEIAAEMEAEAEAKR